MKIWNEYSIQRVYRAIMEDKLIVTLHYNAVNNYLDFHQIWENEYYERLTYLNEIGLYATGVESTFQYWPNLI